MQAQRALLSESGELITPCGPLPVNAEIWEADRWARTIGDYNNSPMESFWSSMQNELLNRKKWKTRLELTNAIFDYIEVFYNRQRRHSSLDYVSPVEFELSMKEEKTA